MSKWTFYWERLFLDTLAAVATALYVVFKRIVLVVTRDHAHNEWQKRFEAWERRFKGRYAPRVAVIGVLLGIALLIAIFMTLAFETSP
jgi:hypothetical protein